MPAKKRASRFTEPRLVPLLIYCLICCLIFLGDGLMSYVTPLFIQSLVGNPLLMGIVMAFSYSGRLLIGDQTKYFITATIYLNSSWILKADKGLIIFTALKYQDCK